MKNRSLTAFAVMMVTLALAGCVAEQKQPVADKAAPGDNLGCKGNCDEPALTVKPKAFDPCKGSCDLAGGEKCVPTAANPNVGVCMTPDCTGKVCGEDDGTGTPCVVTCDDGDGCNGEESCTASGCVAGTPVTCTALDQCHGVGTCDPDTGLCSDPALADGTECSDSSACTTGDQCMAGSCESGTATVCTASNQCHGVGTCDPDTGLCSDPALADGTECEDGNQCTLEDDCQAGVCVSGGLNTCDDDNDCTADSCEPGTGCAHLDISASCSDGDPCTGVESCVPATGCMPGTPVVCPDGQSCNGLGMCAAPEVCGDGIDNDEDGEADCDDTTDCGSTALGYTLNVFSPGGTVSLIYDGLPIAIDITLDDDTDVGTEFAFTCGDLPFAMTVWNDGSDDAQVWVDGEFQADGSWMGELEAFEACVPFSTDPVIGPMCEAPLLRWGNFNSSGTVFWASGGFSIQYPSAGPLVP